MKVSHCHPGGFPSLGPSSRRLEQFDWIARGILHQDLPAALPLYWDGKLALIEDALEVLNVQPSPEIDSGSVRSQLELVLVHLAEALADSTLSSCLPALVQAAEREPGVGHFLREYSDRRRRTLTDLIRRGITAAEVAEDVDPELASRALAGAIFYSRLVMGKPFDPDHVPVLVQSVLRP